MGEGGRCEVSGIDCLCYSRMYGDRANSGPTHARRKKKKQKAPEFSENQTLDLMPSPRGLKSGLKTENPTSPKP